MEGSKERDRDKPTSSDVDSPLLLPGTVLKDRWEVVRKIGGGGFGEIYRAKDHESGQRCALKVESCLSQKQVLKMEVVVLRRLQNLTPHVCTFLGCGRTDKINYIAMSLLGPSLSELRKQRPMQKFSLSTALRVGVQVISAIRALHDCGFLHRDIKPSNFAIGSSSSTKRTCFMFDFGLARQYTTPTGEIRPPRPVAGFRGTVRYASINAHQSNDLGRHDDMWSAFYMLVELATGDLPWKKFRDKEAAGKYKMSYNHKKLIRSLPTEFVDFLDHLKSLNYYQKPDYSLVMSLLRNAMRYMGVHQSDLFDWEQDLSIPSATTASGSAPAIRSINGSQREEGENDGVSKEGGGGGGDGGGGGGGGGESKTNCSEAGVCLNPNAGDEEKEGEEEDKGDDSESKQTNGEVLENGEEKSKGERREEENEEEAEEEANDMQDGNFEEDEEEEGEEGNRESSIPNGLVVSPIQQRQGDQIGGGDGGKKSEKSISFSLEKKEEGQVSRETKSPLLLPPPLLPPPLHPPFLLTSSLLRTGSANGHNDSLDKFFNIKVGADSSPSNSHSNNHHSNHHSNQSVEICILTTTKGGVAKDNVLTNEIESEHGPHITTDSLAPPPEVQLLELMKGSSVQEKIKEKEEEEDRGGFGCREGGGVGGGGGERRGGRGGERRGGRGGAASLGLDYKALALRNICSSSSASTSSPSTPEYGSQSDPDVYPLGLRTQPPVYPDLSVSPRPGFLATTLTTQTTTLRLAHGVDQIGGKREEEEEEVREEEEEEVREEEDEEVREEEDEEVREEEDDDVNLRIHSVLNINLVDDDGNAPPPPISPPSSGLPPPPHSPPSPNPPPHHSPPSLNPSSPHSPPSLTPPPPHSSGSPSPGPPPLDLTTSTPQISWGHDPSRPHPLFRISAPLVYSARDTPPSHTSLLTPHTFTPHPPPHSPPKDHTHLMASRRRRFRRPPKILDKFS